MSNTDQTRRLAKKKIRLIILSLLLSLIQRTAADNLAEDSPAAWFLVFASAFWYWLILTQITHFLILPSVHGWSSACW